jgi:hypothetical protein
MVAFDNVKPQQYETMKIYPHRPHKQDNDSKEGWICGRGVATIRTRTNAVQCFCPPSLYGEYCQYFSDRITITISFSNIPLHVLEQQSNIIKILAFLLSNNNISDHHIFHLPVIFANNLNKKFRFNLLHQRPKLSSDSYTVRFEAYYLSIDSSIKFLAVWEYPIHFPFLPSYRLVQILRFEEEPRLLATTHICRTANPCRHDSTCHPIMNKINNMSAYYCHCKSNSYGKYCEHLLQSEPSPQCSKRALSYPFSLSKSICLCPIDVYGPTCHLNHTCVNRNPCDINRGKFYINPDNITHDYICVCDKKFFGDHCQFDSAVVKINFTDILFIERPLNFIMSSIIQLCDLDNETLDLIVRQKRVYQGLPPSITEVYHNDHQLPMLGIMRLYHKFHLSNDYTANLKQPDYFILYIVSSNVSRINLTSVINMTNYCPYTPIVFRKNVSYVSYLSQCKFCFQSIH